MRLASLALLSVLCGGLVAADPPPKVDPKADVVKLVPGKPVSAIVGKKCVLTIDTTAKKVTWKVPEGVDTLQIDGKRLAVWADVGVYKLVAMVPAGDDVLSTEVVLTVIGPRPPPPGPVPPGPTPPDPPKPPQPVTSFRVIWVRESGATLPIGQQAVMDAKIVRDYLTANTTAEGQWAGWRSYDKDQEATNETPVMKALWQAVKPKLTVVPCVVIEVNGKAEILPYPASADAAVSLFKKYKGN